ncbi:MAG: tannase/feruloyl esterase family alpha/beta hydrolase [Betaproteobacteria bacterium]|nr:MAG: tannase/feruloyl esterase family alpha/beta hydrolase [Betaproteobacteria bacterium]
MKMAKQRSPGAFACAVVLTLALAVSSQGRAHARDRDDGDRQQQKLLECNDTLKDDFQPDSLTAVLLVKAFKKGDFLTLGTPTPTTPQAANDVCVVKLLVGPGNPGPVGAPSTSPGIGIEIWLPARENWNHRIHVTGGGGWAGGNQTNLTVLAGAGGAGSTTPAPSFIATVEGAVSANTDTGHSGPGGGSFAMNPDGSINAVLWNDFAQRGIHEMAVKTKQITRAYYGKDAKYSYWDGFSTGGRQGHKLAQLHPDDFDGILAGAPAFNWTRFITNELYPQIVYQRDLGGTPLTASQLNMLGNAAINACDVVNGQHMGYIPDPSECRYDPTLDPSVICGTSTSANCVTPLQAQAMNKLWYGQTRDGTAPPPSADNSWSVHVGGNHLWYGLARGSNMSGLAGSNPMTGIPAPFTIATDMVALETPDPTLATPSFINATGNGANGWKNLSYAQLANAFDQGVILQASFAHINTDDANLRPFRRSGGKMIIYHGLADVLIMPQGSVNYYERVIREMDGLHEVQKFYRLFLIPGMTHGIGNGTTNPNANPPLPGVAGGDGIADGTSQLYDVLTAWVEKGAAPRRIDISSAVTTAFPVAKSRPICAYPKKATYVSGDINLAASYVCAGGSGRRRP